MKTLAFDDSFVAPAPPDRVFRTDLGEGETPMTWVVSRYEPTRRIEFTCFVRCAKPSSGIGAVPLGCAGARDRAGSASGSAMNPLVQ